MIGPNTSIMMPSNSSVPSVDSIPGSATRAASTSPTTALAHPNTRIEPECGKALVDRLLRPIRC